MWKEARSYVLEVSEMTPNRTRAEQWTAPKHEHTHSVYVRCKDCLTFGVPMPGEYQCGNCSSMNTVSYNPPCCVEQALDEVVRDSDAHRDMWLDISRKAREEGVREGLRRAAGIIRNGPPPGSVICVDGDVCDPGVVSSGYMKWVADKIEAEARGIK